MVLAMISDKSIHLSELTDNTHVKGRLHYVCEPLLCPDSIMILEKLRNHPPLFCQSKWWMSICNRVCQPILLILFKNSTLIYRNYHQRR